MSVIPRMHKMSTSLSALQQPAVASWWLQARRRFSASGLLGGSALLLVGTTTVNLGNYLFNLILGRWLGPVAFADLSLIVTLMLMLTLITATLQTVTARFAAIHVAADHLRDVSSLRRWSLKWAWGVGASVALVLIGGAPLLRDFFNTASIWPFVLLGIGVPVYFAQGVDRGILQGQLRFGRLAASYQAEMWVRLAAGVIAVGVGWSVNGAVGALALSFVAAWFVARAAAADLPPGPRPDHAMRRAVALYSGPVALALIGQILINNSDVLIVKRFFPADAAGQYAALALVGRIVFFATWSVVMVLLPTVAQRHAKGEPHRHLLWLATGLVSAVSAFIVAACWSAAPQIVGVLFGAAYAEIAPLLWLYAVATALYAVANVFVTYRLSIGQSAGAVTALIAGVLQVIVLSLAHDTLAQVIALQIVLMGALVLTLFGTELWMHRRETRCAA